MPSEATRAPSRHLRERARLVDDLQRSIHGRTFNARLNDLLVHEDAAIGVDLELRWSALAQLVAEADAVAGGSR